MNVIEGTINQNLNFNYLNGATAVNGCGVTFMGEFWYFGDDKKVSPVYIV